MVTEKQYEQTIRQLIVLSSVPILSLWNICAASAAEFTKPVGTIIDSELIASSRPLDIGANYFVGQMGPASSEEGMPILSTGCPMKGQFNPMGAPPVGPGFGPPGGPPPPPFGISASGPPMMMMMLPPPGIELQDDQIEKITQLKMNFLDKFEPIKVKLGGLERKYRDSLLNSQLNVSELNKLHRQISEQKATLDDLLNQYTIEMHDVLTSSQRQDVRLRIEKMQLGLPARQFVRPKSI